MCDTVISAEHSTIFSNDLTGITNKWARKVRRKISINQYVRLQDQPILFILNREKYKNDVNENMSQRYIYIYLYIWGKNDFN